MSLPHELTTEAEYLRVCEKYEWVIPPAEMAWLDGPTLDTQYVEIFKNSLSRLEDLRDKVTIRDDLVKYLGHRAHSSSWRDHYIAASKRYISDNADVSLFGLLVRDVQPHEDDLRARVNKLCKDCPDAMGIELLAIYLPEHSIESLGEKVVAIKKGGAQ